MKKILFILVGVIIVFFVCSWIYKQSTDYYYDGNEYLDNISYVISDKFEESEYSRGYYHYYDDGISCSFDINDYSTYSYKNGSDYLKDRITFTLNDEVSEISEVDLNGYKWYYMSVSKRGNINYYYATVKNDRGYILNYEINDYSYGDSLSGDKFCDTEYDKVISSVRFN